jgi:hypothetical protein
MKLTTTCLLLVTILLQTSLAQTTFTVSSFNRTGKEFKYLLLQNSQISANDTINEEILDLVEPQLTDSVVSRRKQHHRLFMVGWMIHAFGGYNWRTVDKHKQKFVGTSKHAGRSGEIEYTEYDIKFHLQFHLNKYLHKNFEAYDLQKKYHRQDVRPSHRTNYKVPPFVRDTNDISIKQYGLGCELTPPHPYIAPLHYLFFPTLPKGGGLKEHANFGDDHPSLGVYGTWCLDCNHNCHPEMHPYEWIWWLNVNDDDMNTDKTWLVGLFHEGSNRFKNWSKNPMTGSIKIPFACRTQGGFDNVIVIDHLVYHRFKDDNLSDLETKFWVLGKESYQSIDIVANETL